jgi:flagellin
MNLTLSSTVGALQAHRSLAISDGRMTASLERLSSGYRINRAADDAAGLAISEGLRSKIGGLRVAVRNAQDGISVIQTAEGALAETHSVLQRMRDLTVQVANTGGLSDDARATLQSEMGHLKKELDRIAGTTAWNGTKLLDGSYSASFQVGTNTADTLDVVVGTAMSAVGLGLAGLDVSTGGGRYEALAGITFPGPGQASVSTAATDTSPAILTWQKPAGTADFSGPGYDVSAYEALDGVLAFGGRSFDLASVQYDATADTDADGTVDSDDLLAQLNAAAAPALGLTVGPFLTPPATDHLQLFIREGVAGYTDDPGSAGTGTALSGAPSDIARATPTFAAAGDAVATIDAAIATVSAARGGLGAVQNRFEHTIDQLGVSLENLTGSESRIRDADVAQESMQFARNQILVQAGTAMLAQANRAPEALLALLN